MICIPHNLMNKQTSNSIQWYASDKHYRHYRRLGLQSRERERERERETCHCPLQVVASLLECKRLRLESSSLVDQQLEFIATVKHLVCVDSKQSTTDLPNQSRAIQQLYVPMFSDMMDLTSSSWPWTSRIRSALGLVLKNS
jgi:hypothetical protein